MFHHYLITRFNIKVADRGPERMNSPEMDLEWLTARLDLFIKYCAPSVLEQSNKNFTWLIYFDPLTPESILKQIQFLKEDEFKTEIIFVKDYSDMLHDLVQKIQTAPFPFVITSRLDNDDAISKHFIHDIQRAFKPQHQMIINFEMGYEYNFPRRVLSKWNSRYNNQFISIIEHQESHDIKSVYGFPHWKPPITAVILNIRGQPYWMYLGHNLNYSSLPISGIPLLVKPKDLNLFPSSCAAINLSVYQTFLYALKWLPRALKRRLKLK